VINMKKAVKTTLAVCVLGSVLGSTFVMAQPSTLTPVEHNKSKLIEIQNQSHETNYGYASHRSRF
jgi:methyl coenzyme M reductase subunit D